MRFYTYSIIILLVLFSCSSTKPVVLNSDNNKEEIIEVIETPTDDTIKNLGNSESDEEVEELIDIDLSKLKKGAYPKIKNDTPFTRDELKILHNSDGLEIEATPEVAHYFKYFLRDKRDMLVRWIDNSRNYIPEVRDEFTQANLPIDLIYLPFLESGYNVKAYSRAGAAGIWQFMPRTATSYGLKSNQALPLTFTQPTPDSAFRYE